MQELKITGYVDRWSACPGETLTFFVSSRTPSYKTDLVRLIHGDPNPAGPGYKVEVIPGVIDGTHQGQEQTIETGSCVVLPGLPASDEATFFLRFQPTLLPHSKDQCLLSLPCSNGETVVIALDADGSLKLGHKSNPSSDLAALAKTESPLTPGAWYQAAVTLSKGQVSIRVEPQDITASTIRLSSENIVVGALDPSAERSILLGAQDIAPHGRGWRPIACYNGKIDTPVLFDRALNEDEVNILMQPDRAEPLVQTAVAAWDFVAESGGKSVPDRLRRRFDGWTLNRPMRLIPGFAFSGNELNPAHAPAEFNAVHLHEDDLADCAWEPSHRLTIPDDLKSGVYALRLEADGFVDHIPFAVRPPVGKTTADIVFLMPSVSYQAYANKLLSPDVLPPENRPIAIDDPQTHMTDYCKANRIRSLYDTHDDGSGIALASMLRPMLNNARPNSRNVFIDGAHELSADLHLLDWLEERGFAYDVVTDHDLDREGASVLNGYKCVLSGTHHEYWTGRMLDGLNEYTDNGGRFMYLSGNGLYWVTAISDDGSMIEIRRDNGTRAWVTERGAGHISLSGEAGGIWALRGRAPQKYVGVGFAAQGMDKGRPYERNDASNHPRARFVFEGIDDNVIGDIPSLVASWGAAGFEVDKADPLFGTPSHALILATATGFSDHYQFVVEEAPAMGPFYSGSLYPGVRADMVFYETPNGGAVFSTGSISWCGCLSYNGYENNVSRLTENVLKRFMSPEPFEL